MTTKTTKTEKRDFKKELSDLYNPSAKDFSVVDVPTLNYLMVDGEGDPNTAQSYKDAVEALFSVSYAIKFAIKKSQGVDYAVMPLEGLWWADDMSTFISRDKASWKWTLIMMQPEPVMKADFKSALADVKEKKDKGDNPALDLLRFDTYKEGLSVQIMHKGPFDDEGPTLKRLHTEYLPENGYVESGLHHEIYLSDIRRADPKNWKTILRQPVKKA
jgi:hypothetical protein